MQKRTPCHPAIASALLAGACLMPLGAQAQASPPDAPITLNIAQQPVQSVLRTLFAAAGVRNFVIAPDVRGESNISLSGVSYSLALKQVLGSVNPPLIADTEDGVTHVRVQTPAPVSANAPLPGFARIPVEMMDGPLPMPEPAADEGQDHFYKIGVKHYDAGVMADLATRPGGIIIVPPNFVVPANAAASAALATPTVTTVGTGPNTAPGALNSYGRTQAAAPTVNNVLPDGVQRIYARESDNSLVIETTPGGLARLPL